ncbi:MAG: hypothetical protein WDN75_00350 [Bacteroidota bacterium]
MSLSYSLLFCLVVNGAMAQIGDPQTVAVDDTTTTERPKKPDSLKEKFYLRNIRFGTDLITVGKNQLNKSFSDGKEMWSLIAGIIILPLTSAAGDAPMIFITMITAIMKIAGTITGPVWILIS